MTQYDYLARNLKKVAGMMIEKDFNKHGAESSSPRWPRWLGLIGDRI